MVSPCFSTILLLPAAYLTVKMIETDNTAKTDMSFFCMSIASEFNSDIPFLSLIPSPSSVVPDIIRLPPAMSFVNFSGYDPEYLLL